MLITKYIPVLKEPEIVEEIKRRIKELEDDRNMLLDDDWPDWEASEDGMELDSLEKMLSASNFYVESKDE
jgi:hypothetical protein